MIGVFFSLGAGALLFFVLATGEEGRLKSLEKAAKAKADAEARGRAIIDGTACPLCGAPTEALRGKRWGRPTGRIRGCSQYPKCHGKVIEPWPQAPSGS